MVRRTPFSSPTRPLPALISAFGSTRSRVPLSALLSVLLSSAAGSNAAEVQVAVASNFAAPMAKIAENFAAATGHVARLSTGSTGKFRAQIVAGAPFELLLAADDETPRDLVAQGLAVAGSEFTYAFGKLVLWSAKPGLVDPAGDVLASGSFAHLAIANPKLAPYGAAAMRVLVDRGLADKLAPRLVTAENIAQAWQFVASGNAELGFVALSQVTQPGQPNTGSRWLVPQALYEPIRQDAVLLVPGRSNPAATALLAFLKGDPGRRVIAEFGYGLPDRVAR